MEGEEGGGKRGGGRRKEEGGRRKEEETRGPSLQNEDPTTQVGWEKVETYRAKESKGGRKRGEI
eukprot:5961474-Pyramimonas_sp.AAC.1